MINTKTYCKKENDIFSNSFSERVANLHIEHPRLKKIWKILDSIRMHNQFQGGSNSPRHRFVIGVSGVGKTQMMRRYAENNAGYIYTDEDGTEYDIRPVVYVNLPDPFTIMELYQSIVESLGAPHISGRPTIGEVKRQVFKLLELQKVEMLILDEMDHILTSRFVKNAEAMGAIKHIANNGKVSVICVGTPAIETLRQLDTQHLRRYPPTKLERFEECNQEFLDLLDSIHNYLKPPANFQFPNSNFAFQQLMHRTSFGLVGYLVPIIQEAYSLLGVFESGFNESETNLDLRIVLETAYQNIVGDVTEEELSTVLSENVKFTNRRYAF